MALIPRFPLFALLLLPYQCEAKDEDCSETKCLLFPDGDDQVPSEFRLKASEKGVRLVHINLVIGNASYYPLELPDVFLPQRWTWANTIREPMLSLPNDYDILSAGLLNYQVRSIDVKLKDQPSGCLAKLNSTCQNLAVGRMLLENVTSSSSSDILLENTPVVCVAVINSAITGDPSAQAMLYRCCDIHKQARAGPATIRCGQRIDVVNWVEIVSKIFYFLSFFFALFTPALPLTLPDYVFSLRDEDEKEQQSYQRLNNESTEGEQNSQRGTEADRVLEEVALGTSTPNNTFTASATSTEDEKENRQAEQTNGEHRPLNNESTEGEQDSQRGTEADRVLEEVALGTSTPNNTFTASATSTEDEKENRQAEQTNGEHRPLNNESTEGEQDSETGAEADRVLEEVALGTSTPNNSFTASATSTEDEKENRQAEQTNGEHQPLTNEATEGEQDSQEGTGADRSNTEGVHLDTSTSNNTSSATATSSEDEKENRQAEQTNGGHQPLTNEATEGEQDNHNTTTNNNDNDTIQEETGQNTSNCVANSRNQDEKNKFIPVDDSSPMNLSTLLRKSVQKLPDIPLSFNIKLGVMCLCVYPCVLYVQMGLYHTLKKASVDEIVKKHVLVDSVFSSGTVFLKLTVDFGERELLVALAVIIITIFISVLLLRPKDFFLQEGELCLFCRFMSFRRNNSFNFSLASRITLGDELYRHLKLLLHYVRRFTVCIFTYHADIGVSIYCCLSLICQSRNMRRESRVCHLFCVFFRLISLILALPFIIVVGVLYLLCSIMVLIILLYLFCPLLTIVFFLLTKISNRLEELRPILRVIVLVFFFILIQVCIYLLLLLLLASWLFILTVVAYTIIGLALNVSIVTPFLAFLLVLTTNLYLCYAKMQRKYKEVKKMISARLQALQVETNAPKGTICAKIYRSVCDKVLPVKSAMCRMLCNMISAAAFLFFALSSIVFIAHEYDISTLTTTISVFFTGTIPPLFLKVLTTRNRIVGWAKIKMEREIDQAVTECRDSRNGEAAEQQMVDTRV